MGRSEDDNGGGRRFRLANLLPLAGIAILCLLVAQSDPKTGAGKTSESTAATSKAGSQPSRLTLATYNINCGLTDEESMAGFSEIIRKSGADVIAIQEGNDTLYAYLKKHLAKEYPRMYFFGKPAAGGLAWVSKIPLANTAVLPSQGGGWSSTVVSQAKVGGRSIQLVNTHLFATIPAPKANLAQVLQTFAQAEQIRDRQIRFIYSKLSTKLPVAMLGDFNSPPGSVAVEFLKDKGFIDSYASANKGAPEATTWQWQVGESMMKLKLDYVLHGEQFKTHKSRIVREGNSDHFMVISEVELLPATATTKPAAKTSASKPAIASERG